MLMARELKEKFNIDIYFDAVDVCCHSFDDNSSDLELAKCPKMRPYTKTVNICDHHFGEYVSQDVSKVQTNDLIGDMSTKRL